MVLSQRAVARQQIAHRVVLPLQGLARRHAGGSRQNASSVRMSICAAPCAISSSARLSLLLLSRSAPYAESFRPDDHHGRLRVDFLGGDAAEARDQRARILAAEQTQFSGEDDELSGERPGPCRPGEGESTNDLRSREPAADGPATWP